MVKLTVYNSKGIKKGTISLPKEFVGKVNLPLLAQAIRVYQDRQHPGLSRVKTRGEVDVSKRKIYRQKGTGGARHGARSAPIFKGGGIAHGPKGVKRVLTLPKKMKKQALNSAIMQKVNDAKIFVVDGLAKLGKTREVAALIDKIGAALKERNQDQRFTFAISDKNSQSVKVIGNLKNVSVIPFRGLNAEKVFFGGNLVIDKDALMDKSIKGTKVAKENKSIKGKKTKKEVSTTKSKKGSRLKQTVKKSQTKK